MTTPGSREGTRRAAILTGLLAVLASPGARAHLGTPYGDAASAILESEVLVLVRATGETRDTARGAATDVETLAVYAGRAPRRLTIRQPPPHVHRHRLGDVFLAPLGRPEAGEYPCIVETATALGVDAGERRELAALVRRWRALPRPTPPGVRVHRALRELAEPRLVPLGRRLVLEELVARPDALREVLAPPQREAILRAVRDETHPVAFRLGLVRVIGLVAESELNRGLCERLPDLRSVPLRAAALETLSHGGGACVRRALDACRQTPGDPLRARCETLARRIE